MPMERILDFLSNPFSQSYCVYVEFPLHTKEVQGLPKCNLWTSHRPSIITPSEPVASELGSYYHFFSQIASDENLIQLKRMKSRQPQCHMSQAVRDSFYFLWFLLSNPCASPFWGLFKPLIFPPRHQHFSSDLLHISLETGALWCAPLKYQTSG